MPRIAQPHQSCLRGWGQQSPRRRHSHIRAVPGSAGSEPSPGKWEQRGQSRLTNCGTPAPAPFPGEANRGPGRCSGLTLARCPRSLPAHLRLLRPQRRCRRLPLGRGHQRLEQLQQPHHGRHQPGHGVGPEAGGEAAQLGAQRPRHAIDVRRGQPARRRSPQRLRHGPGPRTLQPARPAPSGAAPEAGPTRARAPVRTKFIERKSGGTTT